ncbi:MAG: type III polyketide synthase [Pirellulaceae bacterium]
MTCCLTGVATAVPPHRISQYEAAEHGQLLGCETEQQRLFLREVYRKSGVRTRHSVLLEAPAGAPQRQTFFLPAAGREDAGPTTAQRMQKYTASAASLAVRAAAAALDDAAVAPREVTHLVTASCTGFAAPGFDVEMMHTLRLSPEAARTHIGFMGCHAALNALRTAKAYVDGDPNAVVLLAAVELCSLHQQYGGRPELIVSNALFADGAGAAVLRATRSGELSGRHAWQLASSGSMIFPDSRGDMGWTIGDHGFVMQLSKRVPELIEQHVPRWLAHWLDRQQLQIRDVASWAIHPGGPRILECCVQGLRLHEHHLRVSREILAEFGNMSSPTVLFILDRMRQIAAPRPCVAMAFGPGLTVEAALFR